MRNTHLSLLLSSVLISLFWLASCQKTEPNALETPAARQVFADYKAFFKTYDELIKVASKNDLDAWSKAQNCTNLLYTEDSNLKELPFALLAMLNENAEFECGGDIIWYNRGKLYRFDKKDEPNLTVLKSKPEQCQEIGRIETAVLGNVEDRTIILPTDGGEDARNQHQFIQQSYQPCNGELMELRGTRKFVHQVHSARIVIKDENGNKIGDEYKLFLKLKLEYKNSKGKWLPAGEQREMTVVVSGDVNLREDGVILFESPIPFIVNRGFTCSNDVDIWVLSIIDDITIDDFIDEWVLNMRGEIRHHVMGDAASNEWSNQGVLW